MVVRVKLTSPYTVPPQLQRVEPVLPSSLGRAHSLECVDDHSLQERCPLGPTSSERHRTKAIKR